MHDAGNQRIIIYSRHRKRPHIPSGRHRGLINRAFFNIYNSQNQPHHISSQSDSGLLNSAFWLWTKRWTIQSCVNSFLQSSKNRPNKVPLNQPTKMHQRATFQQQFPEPGVNVFARLCTVLVLRMAQRKWKDTKQEPGTAGQGNMLGCCLISFHFLWAILSTSTVQSFPSHHS